MGDRTPMNRVGKTEESHHLRCVMEQRKYSSRKTVNSHAARVPARPRFLRPRDSYAALSLDANRTKSLNKCN